MKPSLALLLLTSALLLTACPKAQPAETAATQPVTPTEARPESVTPPVTLGGAPARPPAAQTPTQQTPAAQAPAAQTQAAQAQAAPPATRPASSSAGARPTQDAPAAPARSTPAPGTPESSRAAPAATPAAPSRPPVTAAPERPATPAPAAARAPERTGPELRGLWVDAFGPGFKTPTEVDTLIRDAQAMNVNALFVQAVKRGDCYCDHAAVPRTDDPDVPAGFDPLADVISKAHAQGIQVHAWLIPTAVSNKAVRYPVTNPEHVINTHGAGSEQPWLMTDRAGNTWAGNDQMIDLGNPDAVAYMTGAIRSLVHNYDLDGIQLDRIRYPDPAVTGVQDWGYNAGAVAAYQAELGVDSQPEPGDPAWVKWRRSRVDQFVKLARDAAKSERNVWVSAAVITYGDGPRTAEAFTRTRTYTDVLQNWPAWLSSGSVDLIVLMNYKRDFKADQARWFDEWNAFAKSVRGRGKVAVGTALYLNDTRGNFKQLDRVLASGLDGWVGYSYRTPSAGVDAGSETAPAVLSALSAHVTAPGAGVFERRATWGRP
ncbi:family 10 glycosylhydrolase [Deinococcus soli (ex Cha et al. 2016)]|uniref:Uncharacterized lipoprotein YddW (UPF0748 family) n=2 Tax=Deinococcus soli (ex Cha et al. 2016) TaxID=1309411 RepID=A0AAE3XCC7_9DEIO|nr:family 10 glycosylhydrolase [Deinococcus soli (ex Cha et al. 2016)]MDR6218892.1 uncharacterized lipoprotein YddW (UPF0748 family) [Deinococcus soli (ex Cha et al. 2016)]MDR6328689.1 uncharacterized lipoprotein YddW (UPF0748 family) [Deinococcus soli (ex Cha et al. 2016)]MDR6751824.1 uncharacterized lipoprotein YddW (UPF0748 family) [Deinococcus soli (ex Cha et al. 2016)]